MNEADIVESAVIPHKEVNISSENPAIHIRKDFAEEKKPIVKNDSNSKVDQNVEIETKKQFIKMIWVKIEENIGELLTGSVSSKVIIARPHG